MADDGHEQISSIRDSNQDDGSIPDSKLISLFAKELNISFLQLSAIDAVITTVPAEKPQEENKGTN